MYPESVSVEASDRERKGEWIEQNRGSNRKYTIGPKYGQVTLTGIKELNSLQAPPKNIRPNLLPATIGPPTLSLSLLIPDLGATSHQRASWPTARRSHRRTPNNEALRITN
jgi:hypothetical protein